MGENISNAEIIRRADVIWIQTNCIGHAAYFGVINLARRYNRKVRYFQYASAAKCAEQIAEEEEKKQDMGVENALCTESPQKNVRKGLAPPGHFRLLQTDLLGQFLL